MVFSTRRVLTVSELTGQVRALLEQRFLNVWVSGEISNLRIPSSGHHYFTLKDERSQIRSVLFRGTAQGLRFALQDGLEVVAYGRVSVYEPRGEYQLILESVEPKGIGALQLAFEQLKAKLTQEGLFDPARKRPLPFFPRTIGVVTSLSGAVIRDILTILERRCPMVRVVVHPVQVQGDGASSQIAEAIRTMNALGEIDVLILARGGGSLEDLWCFNEEPVVRAIVDSAAPVISAVGHEIDVTLADFAADYRAPTPSAAAEIAVPRADEWQGRVRELRDRGESAMRGILTRFSERVQHCWQRLPDPIVWLGHYSQRYDELEARLQRALRDLLIAKHRHCLEWRTRVYLAKPDAPIHDAKMQLSRSRAALGECMAHRLGGARRRVEVGVARLQAASPLAILGRGYSRIETIPERRLVRKSTDVAVGNLVHAHLAQGGLICAVHETVPDA